MRSTALIAIASVALLVLGRPVSAHHAFAAHYDVHKPVTLKRKVTKVELINPHGWLYIDVVGPDGKVHLGR